MTNYYRKSSINNMSFFSRAWIKRVFTSWLLLTATLSSTGRTLTCHALSSRSLQVRRNSWSRNGLQQQQQPMDPSSSSLSPRKNSISVGATTSVVTSNERIGQKDYRWTKQNLAIALPAMIGCMVDPLLSLVDTGFVGRLGAIDLAALGVCTSIFHMAFTVFRASTVATTSLVGSAKSEQEARKITKISIQLAGFLGTLVLVALRFGGSRMLATMGVTKTSPLYKPACDYLFTRCWAAPAVVGIVVAEGAFRGKGDVRTPLVASVAAAIINLILDPILMFPMRLGTMGAAAATALSQIGAGAVYAWRITKRRMLPQKDDISTVSASKVLKAILGANLAMLTKSGSLLVFYTCATALATRMGPMHVATHQVALSFWWLVTMWLDSGSVSGQVLMNKCLSDPDKAWSLTKYMTRYAVFQGVTISALVMGIGRLLPTVFTRDPTVQRLLNQLLPYLSFQQLLISLVLVLEGLAIGSNQFRYMAVGTSAATAVALYRLYKATSVIGIWADAITTFFIIRLILAIIAIGRVQMGLRNQDKIIPKETSSTVL